ncbi:MAG TPA: ABC transporter substrate-binding protein [Rhodocyclaceae bacterium]|nr:ABC transporter substrate-binding protein [Rhodocyclaceae bacterium]
MKKTFKVAAFSALVWAGTALAAEPIKIGLVLPLSGAYAAYGKQIKNGVDLYLAQHGNTLGGRKVEVVVKDDGGLVSELAKRDAQELVIKDKVDILAGFAQTPSALTVAPLATEAKKPMIVMNAAASIITTKSPYIVRTSHSLSQVSAPIALYADKLGIKKVYTLVADFGPGIDAETQFKKSFATNGGQVIGEVRVPLKSPDFSPFLQKIKDAKPDAVFLFLPPGELTVGFLKGFQERGLAKAGIKILATGDLTEEDTLDALGDGALGIINSHHYAESHKSPENKAYTEAYYKAYPKDRPNYMSVGGYDGMALIDEVLKKTGGDADAEKFIAAAKGIKLNSPRGPITIDAKTRDIVQTIYIRKVEKVGKKLQNVEFDKMVDFRDPAKE